MKGALIAGRCGVRDCHDPQCFARSAWEIDVEADDAESAAREAQRYQRLQGAEVGVFDVTDGAAGRRLGVHMIAPVCLPRGWCPTVNPVPIRSISLPFALPTFNELEHARGRRGPNGWNGYNALKRAMQSQAVAVLRRTPKHRGAPVVLVVRWVRPDAKNDLGNVAGGGNKILHDALAEGRDPTPSSPGWPGAGIIHCDAPHCIVGQIDLLAIDRKHPRIEVLLYEVAP